MKIYNIELDGCDASTDFEMELTDDEFKLLKRVEQKSKEVSTYGCMPTMSIELKGYYKNLVSLKL